MTPPPAIVALTREPNSSSLGIASCKRAGGSTLCLHCFDAVRPTQVPLQCGTLGWLSRPPRQVSARVDECGAPAAASQLSASGNCHCLGLCRVTPAFLPAISSSAETQTSKAEQGLVRQPARSCHLVLCCSVLSKYLSLSGITVMVAAESELGSVLSSVFFKFVLNWYFS